MPGSKPIYRKEAKVFCGRKVRKAFFSGTKKVEYFVGTVIECPIFDGEVCYRIEYEDGDSEDIAWEELAKIILPDMEPQKRVLTDATNCMNSVGKHCNTLGDPKDNSLPVKRPRQAVAQGSESPTHHHQSKRVKVEALTTPPTEGPQRPRQPRQNHPRGRDVGEAAELHDVDMEDGDSGPLPGHAQELAATADARGTTHERQQRQSARSRRKSGAESEHRATPGQEGEAAAVDEAKYRENERAKKQAANNQRLEVLAEHQAIAEEAAPPDDEDLPGGFTARTIGSAGHIARIHMENFMCHRHVELDLGMYVTLISGTNGSGKSAVMQALQVCLGVSARETGRGTSLTEFIKNEASEAKVQVTLWNTGLDAFMPETFGNRITVERVLKRAGASAFSLLDSRMHKANLGGERPREVLLRMLDHFALDASNPLTIITQDMARQFLSSNKDDAKLKYSTFMASTLLDKTQENHKGTNAHLAAIKMRFNDTILKYNADRREQGEYNAKLEKLKSANRLLQDREMLERAVVWRAVQQMEERLETAKAAELHNGPELLALYERQLEALAQAKVEQQERKSALDEELRRHEEAVNSHDAEVRALVKAAKEASLSMERAKRNRNAAKRALEQLNGEKQVLDNRLEQETSGMAAEARRLAEEHQQQVTAKQAAVQKANDDLAAAQQALQNARSALDGLRGQEQNSRRAVQNAQHAVIEIQNLMQRVAAGQGNRLAIFNAVELNHLIDLNIRQFQRRPIGPIGALLTVAEERWVVATQVALGSTFRDYLVCCPADAVLLRNLMRQARYSRASVITTSFTTEPYGIPPARRPVPGFPAMMDILRVQDHAMVGPVLNYMVDKFHIEGIALVENAVQGRAVMYSAAAGEHITAAMDIDGNWGRAQCQLVADVTQYLVSLEQDLERNEADLGAQREDLQSVLGRLPAARAEVERCHKEATAANVHKIRAASDLSRVMQAAPEMPRMEEDEATNVVLTQLADLQNELVDSQLQLQNAEEALSIADQAHQQAVQEAQEQKRQWEVRVVEGTRLRELRGEVNKDLEFLDSTRHRVSQKAEGLRAKMEKLRRAVEVAEAQVQQARAAAQQVCDFAEGQQALADARQYASEIVAKQLSNRRQRGALADKDENGLLKVQKASIESLMDFAGLEKQLQRVVADIAKVEKEAGCSDQRELEIRLADANKKLASSLNNYRRVESLLKKFQDLYDKEVRSFERVRQCVETITQRKFAMYLRRRGHDGRLMWNHTERTLKMLIKPGGKTNKDVQPVEDLKQLSGGERSFTTVAFLLAIGANTESPFRCMDEFDVFMDAINRRVATETLLEFAYENPAYQYIFLTPQDIQAVEDARQQVMAKRNITLPSTFLKTVQMRPARENATRV